MTYFLFIIVVYKFPQFNSSELSVGLWEQDVIQVFLSFNGWNILYCSKAVWILIWEYSENTYIWDASHSLISYIFIIARSGGNADLQRKGTRVNIVPIKMLEPGQKISDMKPVS